MENKSRDVYLLFSSETVGGNMLTWQHRVVLPQGVLYRQKGCPDDFGGSVTWYFDSTLPPRPNYRDFCPFSHSFTSYFYSEVLGHHAVSGRQISVDKLVGIEVSHAVGDLPGHLKHLLQWRERQAGPLLLERGRGKDKSWEGRGPVAFCSLWVTTASPLYLPLQHVWTHFGLKTHYSLQLLTVTITIYLVYVLTSATLSALHYS